MHTVRATLALGCTVACLAWSAAAMAGTHVEVPADVRAAFDREYEAYMHAPDGTGYTGGTTALQQQHLDSIARLGPRALPLVMETLRETGDSNLAAVAGRMSKKHFVLSELPDGKPPDQHGWVALCLRWWDREHARTPQRFAELYEVWKQTKRQWMVLGSYELVYDDSFKGIWYSRRAQTKDGELLDEIKALARVIHRISASTEARRPPERLQWARIAISSSQPRRPSHDRLSPATDLQLLSA